MLLQVFGSCCAKFETGQTLSYMHMQTDATTPNIVGQQRWDASRCVRLHVVLSDRASVHT